jgi:TPR repeat protein
MKAAEQSFVMAQHNLGIMYSVGSGCPAHPDLRLHVAGSGSISGGEERRAEQDKLAGEMSPEQSERAKTLGREWRTQPKQR